MATLTDFVLEACDLDAVIYTDRWAGYNDLGNAGFTHANRVLCLAPLRFLGRISYSVYLWHWPLVVFAAALYPTMSKTAQMRLLILLMTVAVGHA
jgi:peptidoglycan/LPS O-acetylase OafA/YrhL